MDPASAIAFLKKLLDFLGGGNRKGVKINDVESFHDVISKIDSPDLKNNEIVKGFKNNTFTLYKKETNDTYNIFVFNKDSPEIDAVFSKIKLEKEKEGSQKVNVFPAEGKINYLEFKDKEKLLKKDYEIILSHINNKHKALLALAIDTKRLHAEKKHDIADDIKKSAAEKYGDDALKFCNLWAQGYLQNIFHLLADKMKTSTEPDKINCDDVIDGFISEADSIAFVHKYYDAQKITSTALKLSTSLSSKKDYVAIHALGSTIKIAEKIDSKIKEECFEYKIVCKKSSHKFSKIWYKGEHGSYIYSLVEQLL